MRLFAKTFNVFLALSLRLRKERRCSLKESVVKKSKKSRKERERRRDERSKKRDPRFFPLFSLFSLFSKKRARNKESDTHTHTHTRERERERDKQTLKHGRGRCVGKIDDILARSTDC